MEFSKSSSGIFKHTLVYTLGNFISRGLSFILLPFYSHYISPSDFGIYSVILSFVTILSTVVNLGLPSIFVKNLSDVKLKDERVDLLSNTFWIVSIFSFFVLLLIILFLKPLNNLIIGNDNYLIEFILGLISIYALNYSYYFSVFYVALEKSQLFVLKNSIASIVHFFLNILLVVFLKIGICGIFISQIISSFVLILLCSEVIKENLKLKFDFDYTLGLLKISFPLLLSGVFSIMVELIDRIFVMKMLGEREAGIYSFGYRIALIYNLFILSFKTAWIPHYFNLDENDDKPLHLGRVLLKIIYYSAILIFLISIFANEVFNLKIGELSLFKSEYQESTKIILIILIGYFFSLLMGFYSIAPYQENKTIHFFIADFLAFIVNVSLNLILIPDYGILGSAYATLFAFAMGFVYLFIYSKNKIKIKVSSWKLLLIVFPGTFSILAYYFSQNVFIGLSALIVLLLAGKRFELLGKGFLRFKLF